MIRGVYLNTMNDDLSKCMKIYQDVFEEKKRKYESDLNKKGDMYVIIDVVIPSKLTKKQKDLFKELSETELDDDSKFTKFNKKLKK